MEFNQGVCFGLISGYFDGVLMTYTCPKDHPDITRGQIRDIVIKFLKDNPGERHLTGSDLGFARLRSGPSLQKGLTAYKPNFCKPSFRLCFGHRLRINRQQGISCLKSSIERQSRLLTFSEKHPSEVVSPVAMYTRDQLICECGHKGALVCKENDTPYSKSWESYRLEGFDGGTASFDSSYCNDPKALLSTLKPKCPQCGQTGRVDYAPST